MGRSRGEQRIIVVDRSDSSKRGYGVNAYTGSGEGSVE